MELQKFIRSSRGLTTPELLVALAIAGILMGVAVPNLISWLPTKQLSDATRQVATDLRLARMKAISQNTKFRINFVSTTTYRFERDTNNNGTYEIPSEIESGPFSLPEGITVTATGPTSEFQPRGTANVASTITLTNGSGETKDVNIALVGRVKI